MSVLCRRQGSPFKALQVYSESISDFGKASKKNICSKEEKAVTGTYTLGWEQLLVIPTQRCFVTEICQDFDDEKVKTTEQKSTGRIFIPS